METNNKLREALTKILNLTNSLDEDCAVDPVEIRDIANAALAAPARNCDVGTAEEQTERWNNENPYPYEWDDRQYYDALYMLKWAQMPYESEAAKMRNRTMPDKWNRYAPCDNSKCEDNDGGKRCCIPNWYGCNERKCNWRKIKKSNESEATDGK